MGWEMDRESGSEQDRRSDEAVEVLREVWAARGQGPQDLADAFGPSKSCKNMRDVGFDGLASSDGDLRAAWRATLAREGKLSQDAGSVLDLMFGPAKS